MLQMIILFIMTAVVVTTGLVAVSQATVQARTQSMAAINQRLDAATLAVEASLKKYPGMQDVGPLAAENDAAGVPNLPASLGVSRETPWGTRFRYCPLSTLDSRASMSVQRTQTNVKMSPGASYNIFNYNGTVIADDVAANNNTGNIPTIKTMGAVAIITAPSKQGDEAPGCNAVTVVGTKAVVPGGYARLAFLPKRLAMPDALVNKTMMLFVSQSGSGDLSGKDYGNTVPIDSAIAEVHRTKPTDVYMILVGSVSPSVGSWVDFTYNGGWARKTTLEGGVLTLPSNQPNGAQTTFEVVGRWQLQNVTLYNARAYIHAASKLTVIGNMEWHTPQDSSNGAPTILLNYGGRFDVYNSSLKFTTAYANSHAIIQNHGTVNLRNAYVWYEGIGSGRYNYIMHNLGRLGMDESNLGAQYNNSGTRPVYQGLAASLPQNTLQGSNNVKILAGSSGLNCWNDYDGSVSFQHSQTNSPGTTYRIADEAEYGAESNMPADGSTASGTTTAASAGYKAGAEQRRVARAQVTGTIQCI